MFSPRAAPPLDQLKLSHILSGDTCPPISFADFAAFVINKDFSTESLLFVLWLQDYQNRWERLKDEQKVCVPLPSLSLAHRAHPFDYLASRAEPASAAKEGRAHLEDAGRRPPAGHCARSIVSTVESHEGNDSINLCEPASSSKLSAMLPRFARRSSLQPTSPPHTQVSESPHPVLPPAGTVFLPFEEQALFLHAQRGFETFLKKGAPHELFVSDELREFAKACLQHSTAPDLFQPIYDEIYFTLEQQCLPRFLLAAKSNINRPKQLFWYFVGAVDFTIGLITFLLLTLLLPAHPFSLRAYRLFSTIFIACGAMQAYSAYRGFCSQVWKRSHRQVWPWEGGELRLGDEEAGLRGKDMAMAQMDVVNTGEEDSFILSSTHPLSNAGALEGFETPSRSFQDSAGSSKISLNLPAVPSLTINNTTSSLSISPSDVYKTKQPSDHNGKMGQDEARQISPFAFDEPDIWGVGPSRQESPKNTFSLPLHGTPVSGSGEPGPAERASRNIRQILSCLSQRRLSHEDLRLPGQASCQEQCRRESYQVSIFGPEKLVEDPRIKKVYSNIRRDIFIVGGIVSVIWVALCLSVPCAGLL
ncbi:hypothetical protein B9479_000206 [Cryptococcus floricola]|uniref:RGS domain-containing protein n=1 Tax=Cryptococcus floricola TaxID=2591691 RepID=A0A5D3B6H5_9TREE|nr:hypothetical protein B9479_000206 [Cryptococcus floricola]